jgi:iron complex transport system substrate-binding protein
MPKQPYLFAMSCHRLLLLLLICLSGLVLGACEGRQRQSPQADFVTVTDDLGRSLEVPRHPQRVLGLAPSATEMLFAVADEGQIVGRSQACNYPARALAKPVVNTYPLDYEQLVLLQPDLVVTLEGMTSAESAARLAALGIPVYFQRLEKVEDILAGLTDLGRLLNRPRRARQLTDSLRAVLRDLRQPAPAGPRPRVLAITGTDPIYVYGRNTLFTDKLRWIGADNALTEDFAQPYPALTREYILKLNPDIIIGGTFEKMEETFFNHYPELRQVKAYREKKIFAVDQDLMTRPGPRVGASIRALNDLVH